MPRTLAFDWEADYLAGVEADVNGSAVHVRRCFRFELPQQSETPLDAAATGRWLADALKRDGISPADAHVVLPREAVVVRKLDLPNVPENELPDLVRFQAATKSSTPLDRLALDYLPLPVQEEDTLRPVLMVTAELERIGRVKDTLAAAGIELKSVGISPVTVAELVMRRAAQQTLNPNHATLVIFQDAHRVEITSLVQQQVMFSHHSRLAGTNDASGLRASLAEVNRTVIALNQAQSDLEIAEVCLIHAGDADPAFASSLADRFVGRFQTLDIARGMGISVGRPADAPGLASYAPALGALLAAGDSRVPAIDFLDPRRAVVAPDRTKLRIGLGAAAAALVTGVGYWLFSAHVADLAAQTAAVEEQVREIDAELKRGQPELDAAGLIGGWTDRTHDPLAVMDRLNRLLPGTDLVYFLQLTMNSPTSGIRGLRTATQDARLKLTGTGVALEQADVRQLNAVLENAGFRVNPPVEGRSRDPDYPYEFKLDAELPPSAPPKALSTTTSVPTHIRPKSI